MNSTLIPHLLFWILVFLNYLFSDYLLRGNKPYWKLLIVELFEKLMNIVGLTNPNQSKISRKENELHEHKDYYNLGSQKEKFIGNVFDSTEEVLRKREKALREFNAELRARDFQVRAKEEEFKDLKQADNLWRKRIKDWGLVMAIVNLGFAVYMMYCR